MFKTICYTLLISVLTANASWARDLSELEDVSIKIIGLDNQESQDAEIIDLPNPNFDQFKRINQPNLGTNDLQQGNEIITTVPTPNN